jgi:hypothetical protein
METVDGGSKRRRRGESVAIEFDGAHGFISAEWQDSAISLDLSELRRKPRNANRHGVWKEVRRQVLTNELSQRAVCETFRLGWHASQQG